MAASGKKPLMRSLGEFFGHIKRGFKTPVKGAPDPNRTVVRESIQEKAIETPEGPITLRRTTIDEVELPRRPQG